MSFGNWLRKELQKRAWGQMELSRRSGVPQGQISNMINGHRHPGPEPCIAIADALGVSREEVFRARGWLLSESEELDFKLSPEAALVAHEIDQLPEPFRRVMLKGAKATADALREEVGG